MASAQEFETPIEEAEELQGLPKILQGITNTLAAALQAHAFSSINDMELIRMITDKLPGAKLCIDELASRKNTLSCKHNTELAEKYKTYLGSIINLALNMIDKAKPPLDKLHAGLKTNVVHLELTAASLLKALIQGYIHAYEDRAIVQEWEIEREKIVTDVPESTSDKDFFEALCEMIVVLHEFCDVFKEICMRLLQVYGKRKEHACDINVKTEEPFEGM